MEDTEDQTTSRSQTNDLMEYDRCSPSPCVSPCFSLNDSFEYGDLLSDLPNFSIRSVSQRDRTMSPIGNELSLLNLSISPISSTHDLSEFDDNENDSDDDTEANNEALDAFSFSNRSQYAIDEAGQYNNESGANDNHNDYCNERISLEEMTANLEPPLTPYKYSMKRLNLETIFEDVFLETPPKRRKSESWSMRKLKRIDSYVREQQLKFEQFTLNESTDRLCDTFHSKIEIS